MKILLLAHTFPPFNASGAVRAAKLAEHFLARGHDLRVLTGRPLPYPETLATSVPAERIIATEWRRIEAPIDALRAKLGARVARDAGGGDAGPSRRSLPMQAVIAYRSLLSVPDAQAGWIRPATAAGRKLLETWRPDLIYSSALPFSSHVAAARLSRLSGAPWVGEFRDLFSGNPYIDLWRTRTRVDTVIERRVMRSASAIVAVSEPMTQYLADLHGKPSATIMNGYDPADFAKAPDCAALFDPEKITLVYTGIIYQGRRDPAVLFEALRRMGPERQRFEIRFYGPAQDGVAAAAAQAGVADVVRTLPPVPHLEALGLQKAADGLLQLLWDSPLERGVLTGKLFEYAGAGRPILSLGCTDGAAAELVREHGLGLATTDPDDVVAFLGDLARRKAAAGTTSLLSRPTRRSAVALTRAAQFGELEACLASHKLLDPSARSI
jgi:glycosyltransferase involved in cell wall biosynthesis